MDECCKDCKKFITPLIVVVVLVLLIAVAVSSWKKKSMPKIYPNVYQAVFLNNDQQYFGHLKGLGTKYPYLTDVYYVRPQGPAVPNPADQQFSLVKLGNEIHGPEDAMYLNWKNVVFWENVKPDSKVAKGIEQEKAMRAGNK